MGNGKCIEAGILTGGVYSRLIEQHKRVYSVDACSPTLHTCGGGNEEIKILEEPLGCALRGRYKNGDGTTAQQATLPDGSNKYLVKENRKYRIRKLTPTKECSRLMGVEDADSANISKRQTERQQYHLYGDSIVTACLMAILGELCGVDYESKIEELAKNICEDRPAEYKQIDGGDRGEN